MAVQGCAAADRERTEKITSARGAVRWRDTSSGPAGHLPLKGKAICRTRSRPGRGTSRKWSVRLRQAAPCVRFHAAKANGPQKPHHFTGSPERRANAQPRKRYWRSGKTGCVWAPRSDVSQTGPQMPCQVAAEEAKTFRGGVSSRQRQSTFDHSPVSFSCRDDAGGTCRRGVVAAPLPSKQKGPVRVRSAAPCATRDRAPLG